MQEVTQKDIPAKLLKDDDTSWTAIIEQVKQLDQTRLANGECMKVSNDTIDAMDFSRPEKRSDFDKIYRMILEWTRAPTEILEWTNKLNLCFLYNYNKAACIYCTQQRVCKFRIVLVVFWG